MNGVRAEVVRAGVVILAVLSFLLMVASLVVGGRLAQPRATGVDSYSRGPLGHQASYHLLNRLGYKVVRQHQPYHHTDVAFFIEPATFVSSTQYGTLLLDDLLAERSELGLASIIVLPKWKLDGDAKVAEAGLAASRLAEIVAPGSTLVWDDEAENRTERRTSRVEGLLGTFELDLPWRQSIVTPEGFETLVGTDEAAIVIMSMDRTRVVVSDPDVFHNFNVQRADHAALVDAILGGAIRGDAAAIDEVFHGHAEVPSLGQLLSEFPAVLLVVQGVLLALFVVIFGYRRFGLTESAPIRHERGPLESVEVSATALAIGQSERRIAWVYARRAVQECAEALGVHGATLAERAARVDAYRAERGRPAEAVSVLADAAMLRSSRRRPGLGAQVAGRAHALLQSTFEDTRFAKRGTRDD